MSARSSSAHPPSFGAWEWGLGLFCLLLYTFTLSPGLLPADSGEYQLTGALLGVAHPPGFALYTLVSGLATRLAFFISPATVINFLSALLAALTLMLISRSVRTLTGSTGAGLCAASALGLSTTFWAQATTANIRMPTALALAWAVERLVTYEKSLAANTPDSLTHRWLTPLGGLALALGLGVSHHGSLIFVASVLGLYALWLRPRVLLKPWPLLWGLLPFAAWLYFPLRAGSYGAPPNLGTLAGFLQHILARGFQGDMLFFANAQALPERLALLGNIFTFQFTWPVLAWMAAGGVAALWRRRPAGAVLLLAWAVHVFIAITYRAPQTVEYLLPAYVLMAVLMGLAFAELFQWAHTAPPSYRLVTRSLTGGLLAVTLIAQARVTLPSYWTLRHDISTRLYAESLLRQSPAGAVILASWHWATPLWYLQYVERQRPDVEVRYVFPRTASLAQDWVDEINSTLPTRPVVVTSFYPPEYNATPYRYLPLAQGWEVRAEALMLPPAELVGAQSFGPWSFSGYQLEAANTFTATSSLAVVAAWQTSAPPEDINFYLHLVGPDGLLYGQADVSYPAARYVTGEILLNRYPLSLQPNAPAGTYALTAGVYRPDGTRLAEVALTTLERPAAAVQALPGNCLPFGAELCLREARLSPSGPFSPGDLVTVELDFQALRPITRDYVVGVSLAHEAYAWQVQSDGTPAGGAIPTLKWITGSRITDRRLLTIPPGAQAGTAQLRLVVYDAFTQFNLPLLNAPFDEQRLSLPLGSIVVDP